jgi:hypothetical protein
MTLRTLLKQPLTIQRRSGTTTDPYGNEVPTTTTTIATTGYLEQTQATEITVDRQTYTTDWRVVLPAGTAIDGSDRIVYGTLTLEVIGKPHEAWNPRVGKVSHLELRCREVAG